PKFLKFLEDGYLYLTRISNFKDPFEGSLPKNHQKHLETLKKVLQLQNSHVESYNYLLKLIKEHFYVNCWHINQYESAAMWSIYSRTNESIAIQSSFLKLQKEVGEQAMLGAVGYVDYEKDSIPYGNIYYPAICKRKSYSYENEFRIINHDLEKVAKDEKSDAYQTIDIDIENLIEEVYISPDAPPYFLELISSISTKYEYNFKITKSKIDEDPFH